MGPDFDVYNALDIFQNGEMLKVIENHDFILTK